MTKKSAYHIKLSQQEREVLESRSRRYTLPYFEVLRAKMILLVAEGRANDEIAASLGVGRDVISLWRKRFFYEAQRCGIVATVSDKTVWRWLNNDAIRPWHHRTRAWAYLAALDVHREKLFGGYEQSTGIEPFNRLVTQVMTQPPYRDARRVFWIIDNGSSHRGRPCVRCLKTPFSNPCMARSTPVGLTRSKSTSRSSSTRHSRPTTSRRCRSQDLA
jgi:hypothetical protein